MTRLSVFLSVRSRLLGLLFAASIPLFAMATSIAWQNYRTVADHSQQRASLVLEAAAAGNGTLLNEIRRVLTVAARDVGRFPGVSGSCPQVVQAVFNVFSDRFGNIAVHDPDGRLICSARPLPRLQPGEIDPTIVGTTIFNRAREHAGEFVVGGITVGAASRQPVLVVGISLGSPAAAGDAQSPRPVLTAGVLVEWLTMNAVVRPSTDPEANVWLLDRSHDPLPFGPSNAHELPPASAMAEVMSHTGVSGPLPARDGLPHTYASTRLPGGIFLLVGLNAAEDLAQAQVVLARRLSVLGLLLLTGLGAVAFGVETTVSRPVRRLYDAVGRWRSGGAFSPGSLDKAPTEVADLARSFTDATAALDARERQLREASARQELLMQEIHHRVKNNLQIIASLLNLQASRIKQPEARAEFQAARDRIRALATLHRHLYAYGELHTINMRSFLIELCTQLLQALGETPAGGRIGLEIDAPELQILSDQAVPIALIVTEAVSNAAKYAFPGGRSGHIGVNLVTYVDADGAPAVQLSIDDDGIGMPGGRAETEAGTRDGIGLQLIRGFARQLGAKLEIRGAEPGEGGGTHYLVDIPLRRQRAAVAESAASETSPDIAAP